ncbi:MAG: DNA polymerase III subunit gamma/tau [Synechocystis sp.]|nr:DNA polymerase III subunit gamma/tau [Synechocystis sp.]
MAYEPLHHKYRPQTFADLVGQTAIAATLSNAIEQKRIAPAYLFTGPRGTGKTSSARILAKSLNCIAGDHPTPTPCGQCETCRAITQGTALDVIEIDAASNTGVDNIREIIERAQFAPVQCRFKVYVIDECHMLSTAAFNALLKTLEEPPEQVVFVLATTDPQRVLPTIISRCQRFDYRRIALEGMVRHLRYIASQESINIDDAALTLVAQIANGGLRDAESLLDQLSLLPDLITPEKVWDLVGAVPEQDLLTLLTAIAGNDAEILMTTCRQIMDRGREPLVVLQNLAAFYLNLLIAKTAPHRSDLVAVTESTWQQLCELAPQWEIKIILAGQQKLKDNEAQLRHTTQPRLWLEVSLLGLLPDACMPMAVIPTQTVQSTAKSTITPIPAATHQSPPPDLKTVSPELNSAPFGSSAAKSSEPQTINAVDSPLTPDDHAPIADPPEPLPTINLEETWERVLDTFTPFLRPLFTTNCALKSLEGNTAIVEITVPAMFKAIHSRQSELEKTFQQACGYPIKVNLRVANPAHHRADPVETPPQATVPLSRPPAIPTQQGPTAPSTTSPAISTAVAARPKTPTSSPAISPPSPSPTVTDTAVNPVPKIPSSPPASPDPADGLNANQARKAIEQFAKNFGGEVIATEGSASPPIDSPARIPAELLKTRPLSNRPPLEVENIEDLPF